MEYIKTYTTNTGRSPAENRFSCYKAPIIYILFILGISGQLLFTLRLRLSSSDGYSIIKVRWKWNYVSTYELFCLYGAVTESSRLIYVYQSEGLNWTLT